MSSVQASFNQHHKPASHSVSCALTPVLTSSLSPSFSPSLSPTLTTLTPALSPTLTTSLLQLTSSVVQLPTAPPPTSALTPSVSPSLMSPITDEGDENFNEFGQDPFSDKCRIPLPDPYSPFEYWLEPSFIRRRNERERQRVRNVNEGFERLRNHLPMDDKEREKRLSKVETLKLAIDYITQLKEILGEDPTKS